jgi:hypothetical protein
MKRKIKEVTMTREEYRTLPEGTVFEEPTQINYEDGTNISVWKPLPLKKGMRVFYRNKCNSRFVIEDYGTIIDPHYIKVEPVHFHNRRQYICDGVIIMLDNEYKVEIYFDETQLNGNKVNINDKIEVEFLDIK